MPLAVNQFTEQLLRSGLMTRVELDVFLQGLPLGTSCEDGQAMARELISANRLTKYQAAAVYQGKTKGLVLGNYVVLDKIGAGGMGHVFKAMHRRMDRIVAIKVLSAKAMSIPDVVERFKREVKAAARLEHPNVVAAYDADEADGIHFLVMQFVDGRDLASLIKDKRVFAEREAVELTLQTARGLEYAHRHGVVHRDIKPGNLLIGKDGVLKILDMGLARIEESVGHVGGGAESNLTQSGQIMGTIDYMSPEQAEDTRKADHRSDVYSLGCTLYAILAGQPMYSGDTVMKKLLAHRESEIPSLRDVRPDVSRTIDTVYRKMVAKLPEDRQQSMMEVVTELEACLRWSQSPGSAIAPGSPIPMPAPRIERLEHEPEPMTFPVVPDAQDPIGSDLALNELVVGPVDAPAPGMSFAVPLARQAGRTMSAVGLNRRASSRSNTSPIIAVVCGIAVSLPLALLFAFIFLGGGNNHQLETRTGTARTSPTSAGKGDETAGKSNPASADFRLFPKPVRSEESKRPAPAVESQLPTKVLEARGQTSDNTQPHPAESRIRWVNENKGNTLCHQREMEWADVDTKTGSTVLRYTETARTADYIELYCPQRNFKVRIYSKKSEIQKASSEKWEWLADGRWDNGPESPIALDVREPRPVVDPVQKQTAIGPSQAEYLTAERRLANLLTENSFEGTRLSSWNRRSWRGNTGAASIVADTSKAGKRALVLRSSKVDDVQFWQSVGVKPKTQYLLSGWIKTQDVVIGQTNGKKGATLSVVGVGETKSLTGTNDWTYATLIFNSGDRTAVELGPRLGNNGSTATGAAWFDDLTLIELALDRDAPEFERSWIGFGTHIKGPSAGKGFKRVELNNILRYESGYFTAKYSWAADGTEVVSQGEFTIEGSILGESIDWMCRSNGAKGSGSLRDGVLFFKWDHQPYAGENWYVPASSMKTSALFAGKYKILEGGRFAFHLELTPDGMATKSHVPSAKGAWLGTSDRALIVWSDGWRDVLIRQGDGYRKLAFPIGSSLTDSPKNPGTAEKLE